MAEMLLPLWSNLYWFKSVTQFLIISLLYFFSYRIFMRSKIWLLKYNWLVSVFSICIFISIFLTLCSLLSLIKSCNSKSYKLLNNEFQL